MSTSKTTGDLTREEIPDVRPRLAFDQIDLVLIYVLRHEALFLEATLELKPEHFNQPGEAGRGLIWQMAVAYHKKYGRLPARPLLEAECLAVMEAMPELYSDAMKSDMVGFLLAVEEYASDVLLQSEVYGRDLLRYFLQERVVMDPLMALVSNIRTGVLKDPGTVFARLSATCSRVNSIGARSASELLPPNWRPKQEFRVSSGITWLDQASDGGFVPRWTYGLFGPFGSFKTGTGIQIAVNFSAQFTALAAQAGGKAKIAVYVVYEGGADAIRMRALGCAAKMPHKRIFEHFAAGSPLSTLGSLQDYETERYRNVPNRATHLGERERLDAALARNANLHIVDLSGSPENPSAGSGGVPEIVAALDRLRRQTGQEIGLVVVDYAKLMVKRYVRAHGIPLADVRHYMGGLPDELRRLVGEQFNAVTVVLQQLNTQANKRAAGTAQHHSDSSEAGDFGESLFYCFTLSQIDKSNGHTTQFNATKTRDGAGLAQPIILQLIGDEEQLVDASSRYVRSNQGRIVSRQVAEAFVTPGEVSIEGDGVPPQRGAVPQPRRGRALSNPGSIGFQPQSQPPPAEPPVPAEQQPPPTEEIPPEEPPPAPPQ